MENKFKTKISFEEMINIIKEITMEHEFTNALICVKCLELFALKKSTKNIRNNVVDIEFKKINALIKLLTFESNKKIQYKPVIHSLRMKIGAEIHNLALKICMDYL